MPVQAPGAVVRVFLIPRGPGRCPVCSDIDRLFEFYPVVVGARGERRGEAHEACLGCLRQWITADEVIELTDMTVSVQDVIDTSREKARARARNRKATDRELEAGRTIGGDRVMGSGSGAAKGDAQNSEWMVEDKHTGKVSLTLTRAVIEKARTQAARTGRRAVIRVGLSDGTELAITSWDDFASAVKEDR